MTQHTRAFLGRSFNSSYLQGSTSIGSWAREGQSWTTGQMRSNGQNGVFKYKKRDTLA